MNGLIRRQLLLYMMKMYRRKQNDQAKPSFAAKYQVYIESIVPYHEEIIVHVNISSYT